MNTIWQNVTWDIARAGGFTAYILLTLAVIVGLALSTKIQSPSRWPRLLNNELHNFLTLLSTIFLVVHVLAVWIDPFTHFGLNEILIPLASTYRPVWMALGIVGLYLGIAIGISTWLRPHIGYKLWRSLHVLTLGIFALATIHGIGTGSDTQTPWALGIYLVSIVLVGLLLCRRLFFSKGKNKHAPAHPVTPARDPRMLDGTREVARVK
jgi:predicted ferric reductase